MLNCLIIQIFYTFRWNIAKKMICESYGLVFGTNSFVALIMQSFLTFTVSDKHGFFACPVRLQYIIYAALHFGISAVFFCSVVYNVFIYLFNKQKIDPKIGKKFSISTDSINTESSIFSQKKNPNGDVQTNQAQEKALALENRLQQNYISEIKTNETFDEVQLKQHEIADGVDV